ncbi:TPA: hypothetical protein AB5D21_003252 [Vibrio cholerae]
MEVMINAYLFLILLYCFCSTLFLRQSLLQDIFHPQVVCRILIPIALLFPYIFIERSIKFEETTVVYLFTLALFFLVALDVISILKNKVSNRNISFPQTSTRLPKLILWVFFLGWCFRTYALKSGMLYGTFLSTQLESQSYSNVVSQANNISTIALFAFLIFRKQDRPGYLVYILILMELVWVFVSGSKIALLYILVPVAMIFIKRRWISVNIKKMLIYGMAILLALKLSFSFVTSYRVAVQSAVANGTEMEMSLILNSFSDNLFGNSDYVHIETKNNEILERLDWFKFFGLLFEREDLYSEYRLGSTYIPIFTWWIPRFIWEDKGSVSIGKWYGKEVLGWDFNSKSEGAVTIWGDALLNFGKVGPFLISFLWILAIISLYNFLSNRGLWSFLALCSIYVRMILGIEQNLAASLVTIQFQIIFITMIWVVFNVFQKVIGSYTITGDNK